METQILKLDAPYQVIYCGGEVGLHVATLIVVDDRRDAEGNFLGIETYSHPVVSYVSKDHPEEGSLLFPKTSEGVVWNKVELKDCTSIILADGRELDFLDYVAFLQGWLQENPNEPLFITQFASRLSMLGVNLALPKIKKGEKVDVWLCRDKDRNMCYSECDLGIALYCPWGEISTMASTLREQEMAYKFLLKAYNKMSVVFLAGDPDCEALAKYLNEYKEENKFPF